MKNMYTDTLQEVYMEFRENLEEAKKIPIEDLIDAANIYNKFSESSGFIYPSDGRSLEFSRAWDSNTSSIQDQELTAYDIMTATSSETTKTVVELYEYLIENNLCDTAKIVHLTGNKDEESHMNGLLKQIGEKKGMYKRLVTPSASKVNPGLRKYMPFGTEFEHKIPPIFQGIKNIAKYIKEHEIYDKIDEKIIKQEIYEETKKIYDKTIDGFSSIIGQLEKSKPIKTNIEMLIESIYKFITKEKKICLLGNKELDHVMYSFKNRLTQIPELTPNISCELINSTQDGSDIFCGSINSNGEDVNVLFGDNHEQYGGERTHYINKDTFRVTVSDSELIPEDVAHNYAMSLSCDAAIAISFKEGDVIGNLVHDNDFFTNFSNTDSQNN